MGCTSFIVEFCNGYSIPSGQALCQEIEAGWMNVRILQGQASGGRGGIHHVRLSGESTL